MKIKFPSIPEPVNMPSNGTYTLGWIEDGEGGVALTEVAGVSDLVERVRDAIEVAIHQNGGFEWMSQEDGNAVARAAIAVVLKEAETLTDLGGDIAFHKLEEALK